MEALPDARFGAASYDTPSTLNGQCRTPNSRPGVLSGFVRALPEVCVSCGVNVAESRVHLQSMRARSPLCLYPSRPITGFMSGVPICGDEAERYLRGGRWTAMILSCQVLPWQGADIQPPPWPAALMSSRTWAAGRCSPSSRFRMLATSRNLGSTSTPGTRRSGLHGRDTAPRVPCRRPT